VTFRTLDVGGDKPLPYLPTPPEANPFLGVRGVRLALAAPDLLRDQLTALVRVAGEHPLGIMVPMVSTPGELRQVHALLDEVLAAETGGVRPPGLELGVMIEVPAAALKAAAFAGLVDFVSIGTNDLTQYTLAVDRGNARLADRFTPHHPSIIRQVHQVLQVGREAGIPVSVCGEMASEPLSAVLLLGLGYDRLSVSPPALPLVKWVVRTVPEPAAARAAESALAAASAGEVTESIRSVVGEYIDIRLLDPHSALPGRGRVATLPPGKTAS
jgi:phosphocarrier protein FPr